MKFYKETHKMKITRSRLKKAIKEAMEGATPDAQLTEIFGFSRGEKEKKRHDALVKATPCTGFDSLQGLQDWAMENLTPRGNAGKRLTKAVEENGWEVERKIIDTVLTQITRPNMRIEKGPQGEHYVVSYRFGDQKQSDAVCEAELKPLVNALTYGKFTDMVERREQSAMQEGKTKTKITKSQLKKIVQEEIEGALADPQLTELFGFGGKKKKAAARKAAAEKYDADADAEEEARLGRLSGIKRAGDEEARARAAAKAKEGSAGSGSSKSAEKENIEEQYKECMKSVEAAVKNRRLGGSEIQQSRDQCSERQQMALKKLSRYRENKTRKSLK
jgi:hypothetical protein